jgi:tRNA G18 (ribose-2'-O)-methylase SpoU
LRLPIVRGIAAPILLAQLKMHPIKVIAASSHSGKGSSGGVGDFRSALRGPAALFIGAEGAGLPAEVQHAADMTISIPMSETVESLNAAVAASLLLYEAARLRKEN